VPKQDKIDDMKSSFYEELERVFYIYLKYQMNNFLDFSVKAGTEDILKLISRNDSLQEISNDNGVTRYRVEFSNRFAALENLDNELDINRVRETIRENIKISTKGYHEFKRHKPCFDEGRSELLDQSNKGTCIGYRI
jgi:hypothetical protein